MTPHSHFSRPRLGFLGVGWIGQRRLTSVVEAGVADIAEIADPSPECRNRAAEVAPDARLVSNIDELLTSNPDGVVISTPSAAHVEQTLACLDAGVPVFCQKPLGRTASEVRCLLDRAREANLLLGVDLSYRHLRGLQRARESIASGGIGNVFATELVFHNAYGPDKAWFYDPKLSGGGCLLDLGIHLVDAALWVTGEHPVSVRGRVLTGGHPANRIEQVEDYATATITFESGAAASLACSWNLHAGQDAEIEFRFLGTKGGIVVRNVGGSFVDFSAELHHGTARTSLADLDRDWQPGAILAWCRRLGSDRTFDEGLEVQSRVAAVLDAIYASSDGDIAITAR